MKGAAHFASRAAFRLPSQAETIEPFISICQACANFSGSRSFASLANARTIARILDKWPAAAWGTGLSAFEGCSFISVLLESKSDSPGHHAAAGHFSNIRADCRAVGQYAN